MYINVCAKRNARETNVRLSLSVSDSQFRCGREDKVILDIGRAVRIRHEC